MIKIIKYTYIVILLALLNVASSCVDDFDRMGKDPYVEGIAELAVELNYEAETSRALTSRAYTGGEAGNAISNIESLVMLVYDGDELYRKYDIIGENITLDPDISNVVNSKDQDNRLPEDKNPVTGEPSGDDKTGKVTFNMKLQSGQNYYIYAVANMGNLSGYEEEIQTRDGLKSISRSWDPEILKNNSEMFGVFSLKPDRDATDKDPLEISALTKTLHSWVRRLASKVTVAFDGSELYNGVEVYVTDIYLKDIPKTCFLGKDNTPGAVAEGETPLSPDKRHEVLHEDGGHINIQTLPENITTIIPTNYLHLCNDEHSYLGAYDNNATAETVDKTHSNIAPALFFYENKQGTGKSKKQDALNDNGDEIPDNKIDFPNPDMNKPGTGWKDEKPFGTYVEVKGFYRCTTADGHVSYGPIIYRFMLGQDVEKDYNATRNTHYQLTLAFKGYGNDADWHIEYQEKRGMYSTSPQYISYLYNKQMVTTIKIVGILKDNSTLKARIVDKTSEFNGIYDSELDPLWRPWGDGTTSFPNIKDSYEWAGISYYYKGTVYDEGAHQGFLSLKKTKLNKLLPPSGYDFDTPSWEIPFNKALEQSRNYYYKERKNGERDYDLGDNNSDELQPLGDAEDGEYTVKITKRNTENVPTERIVKIPLYTRAKELITRTGFTGNNPFYSYPRKQRVQFTATLYKPEKKVYEDTTFMLEIIQVRRILNPKGVWRKAGSTEPFTVRLLRLTEDDNNTGFSDFVSEGAWSAEIMTDPNGIITLSSTRDGSGDDAAPQVFAKRIQGATEKPIDFKINFTGVSGCAIVRVRYHNYTCEHDIFCREGYDPIVLRTDVANKVKWTSYNVDHFKDGYAVLTNSPLDEGSLFRRECEIAITSANNSKFPRPKGDASSVSAPGPFSVIKADGTAGTLPWNDIKGSWSTSDVRREWTIKNTEYRIPTIDEYFQMMSPNEALDFPLSKAYGIIYGDGAKGVQYSRSDAYGYTTTPDGKSEKGMIGVIVYNTANANQVFFPLGTEACGRRKGAGNPNGTGQNRDKPGTLRYATRSEYYGIRSELPAAGAWNYEFYRWNGNIVEPIGFQPLFYDLYRRPGAVYWSRDWYKNGNTGFSMSCALDMNFFTMGFEGFQNAAAANPETSDACFLRLVDIKEESTTK